MSEDETSDGAIYQAQHGEEPPADPFGHPMAWTPVEWALIQLAKGAASCGDCVFCDGAECRRHPPRVGSGLRFPDIKPTTWCGEYRSRAYFQIAMAGDEA